MKMRMHLHLHNENVRLTAVDYLDSEGQPFIAAMLHGGTAHLKEGAASINAPLDSTQLYMDPESARELALLILAALPAKLELATAENGAEFLRRAG